MKKYILVLMIMIISGCSSEEHISTSTKDSPISDAVATHQIDFQPVDSNEDVARIDDIHNDNEIIKSAAVPVFKTIKSTDSNGEPKKIYKFADFGAQLELSRTQIIIGWVAADDTESAKEKSLESIKVAQRVARSLLGLEAGRLVDKVTAGGKGEEIMIDGYKAFATDCMGGSCMLKIYR
ncbi:hypothetical protein [Acinetobacter dispersus]|uniref:hypothetical protein n=1 Tax=Acinetobacter dispersus TaxID=70348 RepID=UPI00132ED45C|nr:hypothetical protein [Acinetobacter dispersus]QHH99219.1 hypothetical protein FPL17_17395 [Acinetobacter dispersus]